jgi:purine nucleoside phosphorylase
MCHVSSPTQKEKSNTYFQQNKNIFIIMFKALGVVLLVATCACGFILPGTQVMPKQVISPQYTRDDTITVHQFEQILDHFKPLDGRTFSQVFRF